MKKIKSGRDFITNVGAGVDAAPHSPSATVQNPSHRLIPKLRHIKAIAVTIDFAD